MAGGPVTEFRPGDVALVCHHNLYGEAIRLVTRARYNHARFVVDKEGGVVEALVRRGASRGQVQPGDLVLRPPLTDEQVARIPEIGERLVRTKYALADVAALGLARCGLMLPVVEERIKRPDRLFCSQLVDYGWELAGYHAFTDGRVPQNVDPGDIGDLALREGWELIQS